jgi:hypothetical protein
MKLALAICSARDWKPHFGVALAGLVGYVMTNGVKDEKLEQFDLIIRSNCSNLCNGRASVVEEAIDRGFTHLLFLDDDGTFPANIIDDLATHKKQFVAVNLPHKSIDSPGTALGMDGQPVRGDGLREVMACGLALALIDLSALTGIARPFFELRWLPEMKQVCGEDFYFIHKLRTAGVKVFVDQDLSRLCGHVGDYEFKLKDDALTIPEFEKLVGGKVEAIESVTQDG